MSKRILAAVLLLVLCFSAACTAEKADETAPVNSYEIVITQQDIDMLRLKKELLGLPDDEQKMIDELVRRRVIFCEAESLDLVMSHEVSKQVNLDVMAHAEQVLQDGDEAEREAAQQMVDHINTYIEKLGVTEAEYWDLAAEDYRRTAAEAALQEHFNAAQSEKVAADPELLAAAWEEYVDALVAAAKVAMPE